MSASDETMAGGMDGLAVSKAIVPIDQSRP